MQYIFKLALSDFWERNLRTLVLVFSLAIPLLGWLALQENNLANAFIDEYFRGQGRRIRQLKRDVPFPAGFEGRRIQNESTSSVRTLAKADTEHVLWHADEPRRDRIPE